jgi:hypothetical protein
MAKVYVGVNKDLGMSKVTALSGASTDCAVEVVIDLAKVGSRREAYEAIDKLRAWVAVTRSWFV